MEINLNFRNKMTATFLFFEPNSASRNSVSSHCRPALFKKGLWTCTLHQIPHQIISWLFQSPATSVTVGKPPRPPLGHTQSNPTAPAMTVNTSRSQSRLSGGPASGSSSNGKEICLLHFNSSQLVYCIILMSKVGLVLFRLTFRKRYWEVVVTSIYLA